MILEEPKQIMTEETKEFVIEELGVYATLYLGPGYPLTGAEQDLHRLVVVLCNILIDS